MLSEKLMEFYAKIEERWLSLLEFLESKGVPAKSYAEFLESKGIPSLPFTIAIIALLTILAIILFAPKTVNANITLLIKDDYGNALSDVRVELLNEKGQRIKLISYAYNNQVVYLENVPYGAELRIVASKEGYESDEASIVIEERDNYVTLTLARKMPKITVKVRAVDAETRTLVNAYCYIMVDKKRIAGVKRDSGIIEFAGIPQGMDVLLVCNADGYEQYSEAKVFESKQVYEIEMYAKGASEQAKASVLIRVLDSKTNELLENCSIRVTDSQGNLISDVNVELCEHLVRVPYGTKLTVSAFSAGYAENTVSYTARKEEEILQIYLNKGTGVKLLVSVSSTQGRALEGVEIKVYDEMLNEVMEAITDSKGIASFDALDVNKSYYVSAYMQGYLPVVQKIKGNAKEVRFTLERATSSNSALVKIRVLDDANYEVANASVTLYRIVGDEKIPSGIPTQKTSFTGVAAIIMPVGLFLAEIESEKGNAELSFEVEAGRTLELIAIVQRETQFITLEIVDENSNKLDGNALIVAKDGTVLYEGSFSNGELLFDSKGYKEAYVRIETGDGRTLEQEVTLEGKEQIKLTLKGPKSEALGFEPRIEFEGIYDELGNKLEALQAGKFAWLQFRANFPEGKQAGIHVRIGSDSITHADEQEAGIYGFDGANAIAIYGKTYMPANNEAIDLANKGVAGEKNKWIELHLASAPGEAVVRVKVKVDDAATQKTVELHYRAWVEHNGMYFRDPEDPILKREKETKEKQALYAETKVELLNITFGTKSESRDANKLITDFEFIDENNERYATDEFEAIKDRIYALKIRLIGKDAMKITINARANEAVALLGFDEKGVEEKEKTISMPLAAQREAEIKLYFKTLAEGAGTLTIAIEDTNVNIAKQFSFNIRGKKAIFISLGDGKRFRLGSRIKFNVEDSEGKPVEDALIKLEAEGKAVLSIKGTGTRNAGENGVYVINTRNLLPGKYSLVVEKPGTTKVERVVYIGIERILVAEPKKLVAELPFGRNETTVSFTIQNYSNNTLSSISYEVVKKPKNFEIELLLPKEIAPNGKAEGKIKVAYIGAKEEHASSVAEIKLSAPLDVVVQSQIRLELTYNKPIPLKCFELKPDEIEANMIGIEGSMYENLLTLSYKASAECNKKLRFDVVFEAEDAKQGIEVIARGFTIAPDESKEIRYRIVNRINRVGETEAKGSLLLKTPEITINVPVKIEFTDAKFALRTNDNIPIYMSEEEKRGMLTGHSMLFVKNQGKLTIENITYSVDVPKGIRVRVLEKLPEEGENIATFTNLLSKSLTPGEKLKPLYIYAEARATELRERKYEGTLTLYGLANGKKFSKQIKLFFHISPPSCLAIAPIDELYYHSESEKSAILVRKIKIKNDCSEMIESLAIEPNEIAGNAVTLNILSKKTALAPGEEVEAQIMIEKARDYVNTMRPDLINVKGMLVVSRKFVRSNSLPVIIEFGRPQALEEGPAYRELELKICEEPEKAVKVRFPVSSDDCATAYCDATQAAKYIVRRMEFVAKDVQRLLQGSGTDVRNYPMCSEEKEFCSFSSIGVPPEVFEVYLKNDYLARDVLEKFSRTSDVLASYTVDYGASFEAILSSATGFTAKRIFLSKPLAGCGRYRISIRGAVQNIQGKLNVDRMFFYVNVVSDREKTAECEQLAQNFANFIPLDRELTPERNYSTWLAVIEAKSELRELAKKVSQRMFASDRVNTGRLTNRIKLELAELETGNVLRIRVPQEVGEAKPVSVVVEINKAYEYGDEKVKQDIEEKASEALARLAEGSFDIDACIGINGDYISIAKIRPLGELRIEGKNEIELYYGRASCTELKVVSETAEQVFLLTNWNVMSDAEKAGISDAWIEVDSEKLNENETVMLEKQEDGSYAKQFKLCIMPSEQIDKAFDKKIKVKAKSATFATKEMKDWFEVTLKLCGVHPYRLIERMAKVEVAPNETKVAYATIAWKGKPDELEFADIIKAAVAHEKARITAELLEEVGKGSPLEQTPAGRKMLTEKRKAYGYYAGACFATSAACHAVTNPLLGIASFGIGPLIEATFDCVVPAFFGFMGTTKFGRSFVEGFSNLPLIRSIKERFRRLFGVGKEPVGLKEQTYADFADHALTAAVGSKVAGLIENEIRLYISTRGLENMKIGNVKPKIGVISEDLANIAAQRFGKEALEGVSDAALRKDILKAFGRSFAAELRKRLLDDTTKKFGEVLTEETIKSITKDTLTSGEVMNLIVNNLDNLPSIKSAAIKAAKGKLFNADEIADKVLKRVVTPEKTSTRELRGRFGENYAKRLAERLKIELDLDSLQLAHGDDIKDLILNNITREFKESFPTSYGNIPKEEIEKVAKIVIKNTLEDVERQYGDEILEAASKRFAKEAMEELSESVGGKVRVTREGRLRRFISILKNWRSTLGKILATLGKSLACGAVSNYTGYLVWRAHIDNVMRSIRERGLLPMPEVVLGDYEKFMHYDAPVLLKYRTYKITMKKSLYGVMSYEIELVDTDEEYAEMKNAIEKDPLAYWVDDCKEFREKPVQEVLGCLVPEAKGVMVPEHAAAYYDNSAYIAENASALGVEEALIMAVLTTLPEKFGPCTISKNWYERREDDRKTTIACVAKTLSEMLAQYGSKEEALKAVCECRSNKERNRYANEVLASYKMWKRYDICEAMARGESS